VTIQIDLQGTGMDLGSPLPIMPTAMLDAGDIQWPELADKMTERMGSLPSAGILEITFANPDVRLPLLEWCRRSGHDLFQMVADGNQTCLWIKKR
jgi:TusA-related sulfurtransferase